MLPKIEILYSYIYDIALHLARKKKYKGSEWKKAFPYAKKFQSRWNKVSKKVLSLFEKTSGLKWREPKIKVYLVRHLDWEFSDPVTLRYGVPIEENLEVLIHELCHNLIIQNMGRLSKDYLKVYRGENNIVTTHIITQAILWLVYEKFYGMKKLKKIIESYKNWKWHYRAWKIVERDGEREIVRRFIKP